MQDKISVCSAEIRGSDGFDCWIMLDTILFTVNMKQCVECEPDKLEVLLACISGPTAHDSFFLCSWTSFIQDGMNFQPTSRYSLWKLLSLALFSGESSSPSKYLCTSWRWGWFMVLFIFYRARFLDFSAIATGNKTVTKLNIIKFLKRFLDMFLWLISLF